jgi:hypothetical protein
VQQAITKVIAKGLCFSIGTTIAIPQGDFFALFREVSENAYFTPEG